MPLGLGRFDFMYSMFRYGEELRRGGGGGLVLLLLGVPLREELDVRVPEVLKLPRAFVPLVLVLLGLPGKELLVLLALLLLQRQEVGKKPGRHLWSITQASKAERRRQIGGARAIAFPGH